MYQHANAGRRLVASTMEDIIGRYGLFFQDLLQRLEALRIDVSGCPVSHLAYRTAGDAEYARVRDRIRRVCLADVENVWNGRRIDKLLLAEPLALPGGREVPLIELIPPPHRHDYPMGLEHCGMVIGEGFEEFVRRHDGVLTGRQDQGPFCQPAYVTFENGTAVKFYRYSLKDVVEKEGRSFLPAAPR